MLTVHIIKITDNSIQNSINNGYHSGWGKEILLPTRTSELGIEGSWW